MKTLSFILLTSALLAGSIGIASAGTPVLFTTNEVSNNVQVAPNGPNRVSYITVYVDGVKKCYTESNGACTSSSLTQAPWPYTAPIPGLTPGLHTARYVWATCNNPEAAGCRRYGEVTHYVNVPDQIDRFDVRIPTVKTRWHGVMYDNVMLNGIDAGTAQGGGVLLKNVMSGCYTASYKYGWPTPSTAWPTLPGSPDPSLWGFDRLCFGSSDTYIPDANGVHVKIEIPDGP